MAGVVRDGGVLGDVTAADLHWGFAVEPVGAHIGKTIMVAELRSLFHGLSADAPLAEARRLVIDENVLLKAAGATRLSVLSALRTLYALDPRVPLYRLLRALWDMSRDDQPLLAALVAGARDPLLRATLPWLTRQTAGTVVAWPDFAGILATAFPARYTPASLKTTAQNIASSWTQAGLLRGKMRKVRVQPSFGPVAATLPLVLGYLLGLRGEELFRSPWAVMLTPTAEALHAAATEAARAGWLTYRRLDDVLEVTFDRLLEQIGVADG